MLLGSANLSNVGISYQGANNTSNNDSGLTAFSHCCIKSQEVRNRSVLGPNHHVSSVAGNICWTLAPLCQYTPAQAPSSQLTGFIFVPPSNFDVIWFSSPPPWALYLSFFGGFVEAPLIRPAVCEASWCSAGCHTPSLTDWLKWQTCELRWSAWHLTSLWQGIT